MSESIVLTRGVPANESFAIDDLVECAESALRDYGTTILQYHPPKGFLPLRAAIAEREGVPVEQVILGNGSIQLLDLLIRTTLSPGDVVLVERPTYDRTIKALRRAGCQVHGIPVESDGLAIEALTRAMQRWRPRMLYLIPDFQNPTGATLSAAKRTAVMSLAAQYETLLVADLPYRPLRYWGQDAPALSDCGDAPLVQMSSFSKLISPGMRVGWMIAPEPMIEAMSTLVESACICPGMIPQGMVYEYLRRGLLEPALERLKALYAPRLRACLDSLERHVPGAHWVKPEGGFFLGVTLPEGITARAVREGAKAQGVTLSDGGAFFPDGDGSRFLRIPFCGVAENDIETALTHVGAVIQEMSVTGR